MEKVFRNYHYKLQEMCDCYMDTDYLVEIMRPIEVQGVTLEVEAIRYFALLILYTLSEKSRQLAVKKQQGTLKVTIEALFDKKILPPPPNEIADKIFEIIRAITHIENDNGEMDFVLGLGSGHVDLRVKIKKNEDEESVKLLFPEF
jgi:hypothetical protein